MSGRGELRDSRMKRERSRNESNGEDGNEKPRGPIAVEDDMVPSVPEPRFRNLEPKRPPSPKIKGDFRDPTPSRLRMSKGLDEIAVVGLLNLFNQAVNMSVSKGIEDVKAVGGFRKLGLLCENLKKTEVRKNE